VTTKFENALAACNMGFDVIPAHFATDGKCSCKDDSCKSKGKHPVGAGWNRKSKLTPDEITQIWTKNPNYNIGIRTGVKANLTVLDIDGQEGLDSLKEAGYTLPNTLTVKTGGGGLHCYFKYTGNPNIITKAGYLPGVDVRNDRNGFVIAPGSMHVSGKEYEWVNSNAEILNVDFEDYLPNHDTTPEISIKTNWDKIILTGLAEGERDTVATKIAGHCRAIGMSKLESMIILQNWDSRNTPPFGPANLDQKINSVWKTHLRKVIMKSDLDLIKFFADMGIEFVCTEKYPGDPSPLVFKFTDGNVTLEKSQLDAATGFNSKMIARFPDKWIKVGSKSTPSFDDIKAAAYSKAILIDRGIISNQFSHLFKIIKKIYEKTPELEQLPRSSEEVDYKQLFELKNKVFVTIENLDEVNELFTSKPALQIPKIIKDLGNCNIEYIEMKTQRGLLGFWGFDKKHVNPDIIKTESEIHDEREYQSRIDKSSKESEEFSHKISPALLPP